MKDLHDHSKQISLNERLEITKLEVQLSEYQMTHDKYMRKLKQEKEHKEMKLPFLFKFLIFICCLFFIKMLFY